MNALEEYLEAHAKVARRLEAIADALSYDSTTDHILGDRWKAKDGTMMAEVRFRDRHGDGDSEAFPQVLLELPDAQFADGLGAFLLDKKVKDERERQDALRRVAEQEEANARKVYETLKARFER